MLRQKEEEKWRKEGTLLLEAFDKNLLALIHFLPSTACCWGFSQDPSVCASDAQLAGKHHEC